MSRQVECFKTLNSPQIQRSLSATINTNSHLEFFDHLFSKGLNSDTKKGTQLPKTEKQKLSQEDPEPCPPFRYSAPHHNQKSIIRTELQCQTPKKTLQLTRLSYNHKNERIWKERFPSQHKIQTKGKFYSVFRGYRNKEKIVEMYRTIRNNQKREMNLQDSCKPKEHPKNKSNHATFDYDGTLIEVTSPPLQDTLNIQIHTPADANIQLDSQYVKNTEEAKALTNSEDLLINNKIIKFYLSEDTKKIKEYESDYLRNFRKIQWKKGIKEKKTNYQPKIPDQNPKTTKNQSFGHPHQSTLLHPHTKKQHPQPNMVNIIHQAAYRQNFFPISNLNSSFSTIKQNKDSSGNQIQKTKYRHQSFKSAYQKILKKKVGFGNRKRNDI